MKISIAGQDYSRALDGAQPLTIERKLNEPSTCNLWLSLPGDGSLAAPARFQRVMIAGDEGTVYFTGYIASNPLPEYAGLGLSGPLFRTSIKAVSDELLLDQALMPQVAGASCETAGALVSALVRQSGSPALTLQAPLLTTAANNFSARNDATWSERAAEIADMARASYRVLNGAISLSAIPVAVHELNETDESLALDQMSFTDGAKRAIANDITVCGQSEPTAYITEYFLGDGLTSQFNLALDPWMPSSGKSSIIHEIFNEPQINSTLWGATGGAGCFALGAKGLTMNGGNGLDGQTVLSWLAPIEMGGTVLLEAIGVTFSPGSTGIVAGFFMQPETAASCAAGFAVTTQPGTGAVTLQPLVLGCAAGVPFNVNTSNQYTLRVRVHCPECERSYSLYSSFGDNGEITAGGQSVLAPGRIQMEIQEFVNGVAAIPVTLYDGSVANLPGFCTAVPASSMNLVGSMRAFYVSNLGSGWVICTPANGSAYTRRVGTAAEAAECEVGRSGKVVFLAGSIPAAGEQIAVSYRAMGRAVGRAVNATSQQAFASAGSPPVAAWIGTVVSPPARSSADCRFAAQVMQQAAASDCALWSGAYRTTNLNLDADVWPGDALQFNAPSMNLNAQLVVRAVKIEYRASLPDMVAYNILFANDWADDLAIRTNTTVPTDAWLPAPISPTLLANLNGLTVTAISGNTVTINTGLAPPAGGGFEVRLRDSVFMAGGDPTLVTRSSAQNITFSRTSFADRFYVRMYDGAVPPNYSEFSAAVFVNLPLSS